jgi:hypothetical protein
MLDLLIREIDVSQDRNARYLRENLRRIKSFLDDVQAGKTTLVNIQQQLLIIGFNYSETYYVTVDGQTMFVLANTPSEPGKVRMIINGVEMRNKSAGSDLHFAVVGNVVTFDPVNAGFGLELVNEMGQPDQVVFQYIIAA